MWSKRDIEQLSDWLMDEHGAFVLNSTIRALLDKAALMARPEDDLPPGVTDDAYDAWREIGVAALGVDLAAAEAERDKLRGLLGACLSTLTCFGWTHGGSPRFCMSCRHGARHTDEIHHARSCVVARSREALGQPVLWKQEGERDGDE